MQTTPSPRVTPILVNAPQRSPEWYQARLGNVTGSEAKKTLRGEITDTARMGAIRSLLNVKAINAKVKATPEYEQLWSKDPIELLTDAGIKIPEPADRVNYRRKLVAERLTGMDPDSDKFVTQEMKWGIITEPLAIAKYQLLTGNPVQNAPFMLHSDIRAGASPDGLVVDRKTGLLGVLECKCLKSTNHLYDVIRKGEVPEEYMVQIHMEMWISGRDFCDFIGYDSRLQDGLDIFVKRIERDDEYLDTVLIPAVTEFLADVQKDENYFRMKKREELERRQKEGVIIMPEVRNGILV